MKGFIMTQTVGRGTNRAAAKARTSRAAQRTPLPEKPAAPRRKATPGKSAPKAERFAADLAPYGWKVATKTRPADRVELTATRGTETIRVAWAAGVFDYADPFNAYTNGDRSRRPRNVSDARTMCTRPIE
jgi:hypothetical protein